MGVLYISGQKDDLIEIEGEISAEFLALDLGEKFGGYLAFSDGTILKVTYDGVWRVFPSVVGDAEYLKEYEAIEGDEEAYSDVVRLSSSYGFKWVVLGKEYEVPRPRYHLFDIPVGQ